MKLRIRGNSIRLRLSQTEVKQFGETEICFDKISFGTKVLTYQLHMAEVDELNAYLSNYTLSVEVPYELGEQWVNNPEMLRFEHNQDLGNGEQLFISVEKDFVCLNNDRNEDESDNFPNPNADKGSC